MFKGPVLDWLRDWLAGYSYVFFIGAMLALYLAAGAIAVVLPLGLLVGIPGRLLLGAGEAEMATEAYGVPAAIFGACTFGMWLFGRSAARGDFNVKKD